MPLPLGTASEPVRSGDGSHTEHDGLYEQAQALRWTVDAFSALRRRSAPRWRSAWISPSAPPRPTPSRWRGNWLRCARSSSRTRCGRKTPTSSLPAPAHLRAHRHRGADPQQVGLAGADRTRSDGLLPGQPVHLRRADRGKEVAGWWKTHYIEQAPHNPLGPVSTAACLHFDLSTPLFAVHELTWRPSVLADVACTDMRLEGGNLTGESPGWASNSTRPPRAYPFGNPACGSCAARTT